MRSAGEVNWAGPEGPDAFAVEVVAAVRAAEDAVGQPIAVDVHEHDVTLGLIRAPADLGTDREPLVRAE